MKRDYFENITMAAKKPCDKNGNINLKNLRCSWCDFEEFKGMPSDISFMQNIFR